MNNKKTTKGRDNTAEIAKKHGKKVSTELPYSYKKGTGKTDKFGRNIPE